MRNNVTLSVNSISSLHGLFKTELERALAKCWWISFAATFAEGGNGSVKESFSKMFGAGWSEGGETASAVAAAAAAGGLILKRVFSFQKTAALISTGFLKYLYFYLKNIYLNQNKKN